MRKINGLDELTIGLEILVSYTKKGADKPALYQGTVIEYGSGPSGEFVKIDTERGPRSLTLDRISEMTTA